MRPRPKSAEADTGVLFSATGEQHVNEALAAIESSLIHNRVPHLLFASPLPPAPPATSLLQVQGFDPDPSGDWFVDTIVNMRRSPFARTLYLDVDVYVVDELIHILRVLEQYDIAVCHETGHRGHHDPEVPSAFYEYNTGVIAWRTSRRTDKFFHCWEATRKAWVREEPFRRAGVGDQRAFRRCIWKHELRVWVLGAEYNFHLPCPATVVEKVRVIHGRHHDYPALAALLNRDRGNRSFRPQLTPGRPMYAKLGHPARAVPGVVPVWPDGTRQLFISGGAGVRPPILSFLLNEHRDLAIGCRRFERIAEWVDHAHFESDIFCVPISSETSAPDQQLYERLRSRLNEKAIRFIGDEAEEYLYVLPSLANRFPSAVFVVAVPELDNVYATLAATSALLTPDVANEVARRAVRQYNEVIRLARRFGEDYGDRLFVLPVDRFLAGESGWLDSLHAFLGLHISPAVLAHYFSLVNDPADSKDLHPPAGAADILEQAVDVEALKWCQTRLEQQLAGIQPTHPKPSAPTAGVSDPPRWLLEPQWRDGRRRDLELQDNPELVETRLRQLSMALTKRSDEALSREQAATLAVAQREANSRDSGKTAQGPRVRRSDGDTLFRITFVLPHQRPTTGGVLAIQQYARSLTQLMDVHLAVQDATPTPLRGTSAGWALNESDLPDADALVMPAEVTDEWLLDPPLRTGRPILYLQGFGGPRDIRGVINLERFGDPCTPTIVDAEPLPNVIAVSTWLASEAAQCGCRVAYVPYGLDRDVFASGPPTDQRAPIVAMMTHEAEWKGTEDGLEALALVLDARPDTQVVLFGTTAVDFPAEFHNAPGRWQVGELLRRACVHVVPSWEEGFGLPGVEALACGAALATTDTKGSRDYAHHEKTALVSRAREPTALAENVIRLLDDVALRAKLIAKASRLLDRNVPSWQASAERFAAAVMGRSGT